MVRDTNIYHVHFSSDPFAVSVVVEDLLDRIVPCCLAKDTLANVEIAVTEAINNIIEHAYAGKPDQPIELQAEQAQDGIVINLTDAGIAMPTGKPPNGARCDLKGPVSSLPEGGFGWSLIRSLVLDLQYCRTRGENHLSFRITEAATPR